DLEQHLATDGVDYEVVVVSRPHNAEIFRNLLARGLRAASVVYDAESLFHRRLSMQAEVETDPGRRRALLADAADMKAREHELVRAADHIVCIAANEAEEVREVTDAPVHVVAPGF